MLIGCVGVVSVENNLENNGFKNGMIIFTKCFNWPIVRYEVNGKSFFA